jgi:hypothetical protein
MVFTSGTIGSCSSPVAASVDWLAARIGPGTPVKIYGG